MAAPARAAADAPIPLLTIERALELAGANNLTMENSRLEVEKAGDDLAAAKTRRLPRLEVRASGKHNLVRQRYNFEQGVFGDFDATGPIPSNETAITSQTGVTGNVSASVSMPLLQQWRIAVDIDQVEVAEQMSRQRLRGDSHEIGKLVKQEYYAILGTQSGLIAVEESIVYYRSLFRLVSRYVAEQIALEYEKMEVGAKLAASEHMAMSLRNDLKTRKERMNQLLDRPVDTRFDVSPMPGPLPVTLDPDRAVSEAVRQRPDVSEARLRLEHEKLGKELKELEYLPEIDLKLRYSRLYNVDLVPDEDATVGLHARWEFYNWGRRQDEIGKKTKAVTQAQNRLQETESRVEIEVRNNIRKVNEAGDQIRVTRIAQQAAREKLRVITNRYREQSALLQDALRAESELSDANDKYIQAVLSLWNARAELEKSLGSDDVL